MLGFGSNFDIVITLLQDDKKEQINLDAQNDLSYCHVYIFNNITVNILIVN